MGESDEAGAMKAGNRSVSIAAWSVLIAANGIVLLAIAWMLLMPVTTVVLPNGYRGWAIIALDPNATQPGGFLTRSTYTIPESGILRASSLRWLDRYPGFPINCRYEDGTEIAKWRGGFEKEMSWNFFPRTTLPHPFVVVSVMPGGQQKWMMLTPEQLEDLHTNGVPEGFVVPHEIPGAAK